MEKLDLNDSDSEDEPKKVNLTEILGTKIFDKKISIFRQDFYFLSKFFQSDDESEDENDRLDQTTRSGRNVRKRIIEGTKESEKNKRTSVANSSAGSSNSSVVRDRSTETESEKEESEKENSNIQMDRNVTQRYENSDFGPSFDF